MSWKPDHLDLTVLNLALDEDLGVPRRDNTSEWLFPVADNRRYQAKILSKHKECITICGIEWLRLLFAQLSPHCNIRTSYVDGQRLHPDEELLIIEGDAITLLKGERTALNFLRHLCAIATLTAKYVDRIKGSALKILDTRKTSPGLRRLEKYAVYCGGGVNHRMGLFDAIMVKDTHVDLLGGMEQTIKKLPELTLQSLPVIVEVRTIKELDTVLSLGQTKVNRVLLDNMTLANMRTCVAACQRIFDTEASGNISLDSILDIAETGVNYASVGELTYGAGQVDLSMQSIGQLA